MEHRTTILINGIECTCGEKQLLNFVPDEEVIKGMVLQHWIDAEVIPVTPPSAASSR